MGLTKQAYLKCKTSGELFVDCPVVEFNSVYIGYPHGACIVIKEHLKQLSDKSCLVKLIGSLSENDDRHPTPKDKKYVFIKLNSILDQGIAHFLVPKEDIVYLDN